MRQNLVLSGRYRLDALIGRGGMGEVWRGTDLRLGRDVAVKLLPREQADDERAVRRFEREAAAAAALRHRGITVVFDSGADDEHRLLFTVMELLEGENLQQLLTRNPEGLPPGQVRDFGVQLASALAAAHQRGVVHRDIKPANVILQPDGELKICDFGIARFADYTGSLTQGVIGTPHYMAPEQLSGETVDGRTDLYSLGCLLYALASGHPPLTADSVHGLLYQHMNVPPRPLTELRPAFPADLAALIMQCLAKRPEERPPSAGELADALRRAGAPGATAPTSPAAAAPAWHGFPPPVPPPVPPPAPAGPWSKLRQVAVIASVVVLAMAAAAFALVQAYERPEKSRAPLTSHTPSTPGSGAPSPVPGGWVRYERDEYRQADCVPSGTGYSLESSGRPGGVSFCTISTEPIENVAIDTTVELTRTQCASFTFREKNEAFYELATCANGDVLARKWGDEFPKVLVDEKDGVPFHGPVRITALAVGDTLSLYLDGEMLTRVTGVEHPAGGIGLGISVMREEEAGQVPFGDFTVWRAPGSSP